MGRRDELDGALNAPPEPEQEPDTSVAHMLMHMSGSQAGASSHHLQQQQQQQAEAAAAQAAAQAAAMSQHGMMMMPHGSAAAMAMAQQGMMMHAAAAGWGAFPGMGMQATASTSKEQEAAAQYYLQLAAQGYPTLGYTAAS